MSGIPAADEFWLHPRYVGIRSGFLTSLADAIISNSPVDWDENDRLDLSHDAD